MFNGHTSEDMSDIAGSPLSECVMCRDIALLCQAPWLKGMNATWANSKVTRDIEWQICQDYTVLSDSRHYFWTPCNCRARLQPSLLWEMRPQPRYLVYSSQVPPLSEAGLERKPI